MGCILCYASIVLLGLDARFLDLQGYGINCNVRKLTVNDPFLTYDIAVTFQEEIFLHFGEQCTKAANVEFPIRQVLTRVRTNF